MIPIKPVRIRPQHLEILEQRAHASPHHDLQHYFDNTHYEQFAPKSQMSFVTIAKRQFFLNH
jgi:hypothetical protein